MKEGKIVKLTVALFIRVNSLLQYPTYKHTRVENSLCE
jgi:hypothetical protein